MIKLKRLITEQFSDQDIKNIYSLIGRIIGISLPKKKIKNDRLDVELEDETKINIGHGIVVIDRWDGIKNFDKIVAEFKKVFGDVYTKGKQYINARDYGKNYEEYFKIMPPNNIKPLPKVNVKIIKTKEDAEKAVKLISNFMDSRKCKTDTKNIKNVPGKLLFSSTDKIYYIIEINNDTYLYDRFNFYFAKTFKEAKELLDLLVVYRKVMRALEVASWDIARMGPEGAFD